MADRNPQSEAAEPTDKNDSEIKNDNQLVGLLEIAELLAEWQRNRPSLSETQSVSTLEGILEKLEGLSKKEK